MPGGQTADYTYVDPELQAVYPLISRRFQSFAEAADAALDAVATQIPGEVLLGEIESDEGMLRILDVRGATSVGIERGHVLPLAGLPSSRAAVDRERTALQGVRGGEELDGEHLRTLGIVEWISLPLEMSDGHVAGLIGALSRRQGDYRAEQVVLLGLAARVLAYEWERVRMRVQLRELRQRIIDEGRLDEDTGLPDREAFIDLLDREWRLAQRGTVDSVVLACRVNAADEQEGSPLARLALKDAAEVLAAAVRSTDHVGRTREMELGVVLIGCASEQDVEALARRFSEALGRVTRTRAVAVSVSIGAHSLGEAGSAAEALERAEEDADHEDDGARTGEAVR
jgi:GGDEF domain-containing protein